MGARGHWLPNNGDEEGRPNDHVDQGEMLIMESNVVAADGGRICTDGVMILPDGTPVRMLMDDEATAPGPALQSL